MNFRRITISQLSLSLSLMVLAVHTAYATPSVAREWNEQLLGAIRRNVPHPPAHARNLFHTAVVMYDAWAAYDASAVGYVSNEKISPLPNDVEAARKEAISYAAYRLLKSRFPVPPNPGQFDPNYQAYLNAITTNTYLDNQLIALYGAGAPATALASVTTATTPSELGKRMGQAIIVWGAADGFSNTSYPQAYSSAVNPNYDSSNPFAAHPHAMIVMGNNGEFPSRANMQLGVGIPMIANWQQGYYVDTDPNYWQPLALSSSVSQNGIPLPGGVQTFVGVQGLATTPFSLTRTNPVGPWVDIGPPSKLSTPGNPSTTDASYKAGALDVLTLGSQLNDNTMIDISPGAWGNNPLGADTGTGRPVNPVTNLPYASNMVKRGDFARVLAEFWADGPNSETPPGHWHVLANEVTESMGTQNIPKKIRGAGPTLNDLEWDIKMYFALAGATHDAACAAWSLKRYYNGPRPITTIRYLGTTGQLPLSPGISEVVTAATAAAHHNQIWKVYDNAYLPGTSFIGKHVVYAWPGEHHLNLPAPSIATNQNTLRWMLAEDWLPFQRKTFNTPAFPGYISGHSTFSRSAAEAITLFTGSSNFPGGFAHHTVAANSMQIDLGPSTAVDLQWCSYYDAADQAGISRRYGGIHPAEDDLPARILGAEVGKQAYALAEKYWTGLILEEEIKPSMTRHANGIVDVKWKATRGMYHRVSSSTNLHSWTLEPSSPNAIAYDTNGAWTDTSPDPTRKFYRILRSVAPITAP